MRTTETSQRDLLDSYAILRQVIRLVLTSDPNAGLMVRKIVAEEMPPGGLVMRSEDTHDHVSIDASLR